MCEKVLESIKSIKRMKRHEKALESIKSIGRHEKSDRIFRNGGNDESTGDKEKEPEQGKKKAKKTDVSDADGILCSASCGSSGSCNRSWQLAGDSKSSCQRGEPGDSDTDDGRV